ncbi:MAG TPA: BlaI/MecI/CopY family transcriptional regulator [Pseudonocardiaceae bacterium]|jgi:predicted transcriptional regulator
MRGLGELQTAVMNVLWDATQPLKVREVLDRLDTGKPLAYTTVMTVLDNLHRKSWACREMDGNAYRYRPAISRPEAAARALRDILDTSGDPDAVLRHFAGSVSEHESALLRKALRARPVS